MVDTSTAFSFAHETIVRIQWTHTTIQHITEELSTDAFCRSFGPTAPPIGWHVWHIVRWADRLQATLPNGTAHPHPDHGIWQQQELAAQWGLDPDALGVFESGVEMALVDAIALPTRIEQGALAGYVREVTQRLERLLNELDPQALTQLRCGIKDFRVEDGKVIPIPNRETTVWDDLVYHLAHASRHLGMIEALRGLLNVRGTASI